MNDQDKKDFESWWQNEGQYCRSGGGDYEKTFAYRAYEKAKLATLPHAPDYKQQSKQKASEQKACSECGGNGAGGEHEDDCKYAAPEREQQANMLPDEVLVLLNHIEDVLPDEAWNLIDVKAWNAVTMLKAQHPINTLQLPEDFVDDLAQEIRRVDGNHSLGACALAEALTPFLLNVMATRSENANDESAQHRKTPKG